MQITQSVGSVWHEQCLTLVRSIWYRTDMMQTIETRCRWAAIVEEPNTAQIVCARIAEGESLRDIAASWEVPVGRMLAWVLSDEDRYKAYCKATEIAAHALMHEVIAIADSDGPDVGRDKLRIETRFKVAAAHARDRYGAQSAGGGSTNVQVIVQRMGANDAR